MRGNTGIYLQCPIGNIDILKEGKNFVHHNSRKDKASDVQHWFFSFNPIADAYIYLIFNNPANN